MTFDDLKSAVASGTVDTGFGIKAVAEQFKLDFVPCS